MSKIAICDDEKIQLDILERSIRECGLFEAERTEIHRFERGEDLIRAVRKSPDYDFIFLDIQMPKKNGFETFDELEITSNTKLIFVSAYPEKLPEVIARKNPPFLCKPYTVDILYCTIKVILSQQVKEYILVYKENGEKCIISSREICYIEVYSHEIKATTNKDKMIELERVSLTSLESSLKPFDFIRCHRSYLINLNYYINHGKSQLCLQVHNKTEKIPLSRSSKSQVDRAVLKFKMMGDANES